MKNYFLALSLATLMSGCDHSQDQGNAAATADSTATKKFYGAEFDIATAVAATALPTKMEGQDSLQIVLSGKIVETCAKAGCWMTVDIGQTEPMWVYTDHQFFVPTEGCAGLPSTISGVARKEIQTVDEQKHYAEDAEKSSEEIAAITEPKTVYTIDATGIMIEGYMGGESHEGHDHEHEGEEHEHTEETKSNN